MYFGCKTTPPQWPGIAKFFCRTWLNAKDSTLCKIGRSAAKLPLGEPSALVSWPWAILNITYTTTSTGILLRHHLLLWEILKRVLVCAYQSAVPHQCIEWWRIERRLLQHRTLAQRVGHLTKLWLHSSISRIDGGTNGCVNTSTSSRVIKKFSGRHAASRSKHGLLELRIESRAGESCCIWIKWNWAIWV